MAEGKSGWEKWAEKKAKKALKKASIGYIIIILVSVIIGLALGMYVCKNVLIKNDTFHINGEKYNTVTVGETLSYTDEGVTCVSMGRSCADDVEITTNMTRSEDGRTFTGKTDEACEYYIQYTVKSGRYKGLSRIRVFTVIPETAVGE